MRVRIGIVGVLGFGLSVTVALAQQPGGQRRATLLPPQPLEPSEMPPVARGAAEDLPPFPGSTPVNRPAVAGGPAWLNSTDPNVQPAGATVGNTKQPVRPLTPP